MCNLSALAQMHTILPVLLVLKVIVFRSITGIDPVEPRHKRLVRRRQVAH